MAIAEGAGRSGLGVDRGDGGGATVLRDHNGSAGMSLVTRRVGGGRHDQIDPAAAVTEAFVAQAQRAGSEVFGVGRDLAVAGGILAFIAEDGHRDGDGTGTIVGGGDGQADVD